MHVEIPGYFYNDPKMSSVDLEKINILSELVCSEKWAQFVSTKSRHLMLMQEDEWPAKIVAENKYWYHWLDDWNDENFTHFSTLLSTIDISELSTVYVFWMKEVGLKTNWKVFCNNWGNFLFEDEGCILVIPDSELALIFSNGHTWLERRYNLNEKQ